MEKDQRDLLLAFNEKSVRSLIVGGYALPGPIAFRAQPATAFPFDISLLII
jgi:hypothetical protein